jgi:hypothetical protein
MNLDLVTREGINLRLKALFFLAGPSLFALIVSFVIDKFFHTTSSAIAATLSSVLSISFVLCAYYYVFFLDTSEMPGLLIPVIVFIQSLGYMLLFVITWLSAGLLLSAMRKRKL